MNEVKLTDINILKEYIEQWFVKDKYYTGRKHDKIPKTELLDIIENAPTVDLVVARGTNGIVIPITRQKGEWVAGDATYSVWKCTKCSHVYKICHNFCPWCGADMR